MDDDIRENLKELGDHLESVARQLKSTKSSLTSIRAMSQTLELGKNTLDTYIGIQEARYS